MEVLPSDVWEEILVNGGAGILLLTAKAFHPLVDDDYKKGLPSMLCESLRVRHGCEKYGVLNVDKLGSISDKMFKIYVCSNYFAKSGYDFDVALVPTVIELVKQKRPMALRHLLEYTPKTPGFLKRCLIMQLIKNSMYPQQWTVYDHELRLSSAFSRYSNDDMFSRENILQCALEYNRFDIFQQLYSRVEGLQWTVWITRLMSAKPPLYVMDWFVWNCVPDHQEDFYVFVDLLKMCEGITVRAGQKGDLYSVVRYAVECLDEKLFSCIMWYMDGLELEFDNADIATVDDSQFLAFVRKQWVHRFGDIFNLNM